MFTDFSIWRLKVSTVRYSVVRDCEVYQKTKPVPPRSRFSGVRAKDFGDVVFMDHCEIKHKSKKHQLFLALDSSESGCIHILASRSGW